MWGNGTGEATTEVFYTYDELHQVVTAKENYGNKSRNYQYDSLGNLTLESNSNNVTVDYKLNNLNQITSSSDDGWKTSTAYSYDKRGNLIQELYTKNKKQSVTGAYTFDETNKMVKGVNDLGESSEYLYNGLGALVTNTWTIKKNAYGYHDVTALVEDSMVDGEIVVDKQTGKKDKKDKKDPEIVLADANLNKTSTVVKDFVVDYTVETMDPLYETEGITDGLEYRYVYGLNGVRLSVTVKGVENGAGKLIENGNEIRLYYHQDLRGTVDYLTSPVSGKVESWTHYNEWGEITHNAVLKCGHRELDLVKNYTGHEYDAVLGMYYAKARFYDAEARRFISMDPVKGDIVDSLSLVQYLYVKDNPLIWTDPLGLKPLIDTMMYESVRELLEKKYSATLNQVPNTNNYTATFDVGHDVNITVEVFNSLNDAKRKIVFTSQVDESLKYVTTVESNRNVYYFSEDHHTNYIKVGTFNKIICNLRSKVLKARGDNENISINNMLLYESERPPKYMDSDKKVVASDMKANDKSKEDFLTDFNAAQSAVLLAMASRYDRPPASSSVLPPQGEEDVIKTMMKLADIHTMGDLKMRPVIKDMFNHFLDGTGTDYRNSTLTDYVSKQQQTKDFVRRNNQIISQYIQWYHGDIESFKNTTSFESDMYSVPRINFSTLGDMFNGLEITLHDTWGYTVEMVEFTSDGIGYNGTLKYTIYDHFGLDDEDVKKFFAYDGFVAWYTLQHYKGANGKYKPFVTYVELEEAIKGSY